jgi:acetyltransferase-like isoleucine patch superfamily enzyme
MMFKIFWIIRGILYKPFFGKYNLPSYIGKPVYIKNINRIFIGSKVRIFPGSRIEVVDKKSSITFKNNITIGQNFHITSAGNLVLSEGVTIANNVTVTNIDHSYEQIGVSIMSQPFLHKETYIGKNCFIGKGAVIQAGTVLGEQCIIGANAVVRGNYPDYCVIAGVPAKIVKRYNVYTKKWEFEEK